MNTEIPGFARKKRKPTWSFFIRADLGMSWDVRLVELCWIGGKETHKKTNGMMECTPPKTNMEPENGPLEKEIPIGNHHFQVPC